MTTRETTNGIFFVVVVLRLLHAQRRARFKHLVTENIFSHKQSESESVCSVDASFFLPNHVTPSAVIFCPKHITVKKNPKKLHLL